MTVRDATKVYFKLYNGNTIPALGIGTANYGDRTKHTKQAVIDAVKAGYRHIDTAWGYGTEKYVGEALKELFAEGVVKREDLFITTKAATPLADNPQLSLDKSLEDLGVDYVDLLLEHWPLKIPVELDDNGEVVKKIATVDNLEQVEYDFPQYYKNIEDVFLNNKDKVRNIGVSNYSIPFLEKLLKTARVKPVINQVELHPHLPQVDLVKFCEKNDILITAFSPVGGPGAPILDLPIIKEMAEKYDTTPNAILNSFHILQGRIVVPKSIHKDRIEAATVLVDITKEDLDKLTDFGVKNPKRYVAEDVGKKIGFDNWD